jgi:hypothetical protein
MEVKSKLDTPPLPAVALAIKLYVFAIMPS